MSSDCALSALYPPLTLDTLNDSLTKWFGEKVAFSHWEYVSKTGQGDSYQSETIRIRISGRTQDGTIKTVQLVVKRIPLNVATRLTFRSDEQFRNEISFYETVLPALVEFQSTKSVREPFDNYAKVFFSFCDGENDVICLEDERPLGYVNALRQEGIDLDHVRVSFKIVAKFHALSFAMKDQRPEEFERLVKAICELESVDGHCEWFGKFWENLCDIAIDAVEQEYPNSVYLEKVKEYAVPERLSSLVKLLKTSKYAVLCHGDCWTNNYLYKYEEGKCIAAKIIDFQIVKYCSPVIDVTTVIYSCTTQDLRLKHYDELLKYYHDELSRQIGELGSDPKAIYPWEAFMDEVKRFSCYGLYLSFESTPLIVLPPEEASLIDLQGDQAVNLVDALKVSKFKTTEGRLREANNVVHCVDNGYI